MEQLPWYLKPTGKGAQVRDVRYWLRHGDGVRVLAGAHSGSEGKVETVSAQVVLDRWWGPTGGKRDFAAEGIAIEVKVTGANSRLHHIASLDQLDALSPEEHVYIYLIGVKSEPTFDRRLPTYVADVQAQMIDAAGEPDLEALESFSDKFISAGYDRGYEDLYRSGPGLLINPLLLPRLYRVADHDRLQLSSFKHNELPSMVTSVSYYLNLLGNPLSGPEAELVFEELITSPTVSHL